MSITIGSNVSSLQAQRQLFQTERDLSTVFERLSSGQRINRASDDAAGLAISQSLNTDQRVFTQAVRNLGDAISLTNIYDSTLEQLSLIVTRQGELATQAANGSLSTEQRLALDSEYESLGKEYNRILSSTEFNELSLFDVDESNIRFQIGYGVDGSIAADLNQELSRLAGSGNFNASVSLHFGSLNALSKDFNNDGISDLVGTGGDTIYVTLGSSDGTYSTSEREVVNEDGVRSGDFVVGDFNGDGILDTYSIHDVEYVADDAFFLLGNGDGTLGSSIAAANYVNIAVQEGYDFDNDGADEILEHSFGNFTVVNFDGSEVTSSLGVGPYTSGTNHVRVADFNGDSNLDLVFGEGVFSGEVFIAFGNGDGSFQAAQTVVDGRFGSSRVFTSDFNRDGAADLIYQDQSSQSLMLISGNGDGTFSSASTIDPSASIVTVFSGFAADINTDGHTDFVYNSTILFGNGDGTFSSQFSSDGNGVNGEVFGDFNDDGVVDRFEGRDVYLAETEDTVSFKFGSLITAADARATIDSSKELLDKLSLERGSIGAIQSRLQSALGTLGATIENYAQASSRIQDADIAGESAELVRLGILRESAAAVLAQANSQPALALSLLR